MNRRNTNLGIELVLAGAMSLSACGPCRSVPLAPRTVHPVGCSDTVLRFGDVPAGPDLAVTVTIEGDTVRCAVPDQGVVDPTPTCRFRLGRIDGQVDVMLEEHPKFIRVELLQGQARVASWEGRPEYRSTCGGGTRCRSAMVVIGRAPPPAHSR